MREQRCGTNDVNNVVQVGLLLLCGLCDFRVINLEIANSDVWKTGLSRVPEEGSFLV